MLQGNYSVYALKELTEDPYTQNLQNHVFTCGYFMEKVGGFHVDGSNISYHSQLAMDWPVSTIANETCIIKILMLVNVC